MMPHKISLKEVERKAFTTTFQDGLWDIFIGCFTLQFAIGPMLPLGDFWSSAVFLPFFALVFVVLRLIRKYVVVPRAGRVKFGSWRRTRLIKFNVVIFVVLTFSLILGALSFVQFDAVPGWVHTARFSLVFLIVYCVAAYFLDFTRLYIYGILVALSPVIGELLYVYLKAPHHGFPITFGLASGIILLTGLVLFVRFLRSHAMPTDLPLNEETTM
jgi:hypothetical protein